MAYHGVPREANKAEEAGSAVHFRSSRAFRFHQLRDSEDWISNDLDGLRLEKMVVVDSRPPAQALLHSL